MSDPTVEPASIPTTTPAAAPATATPDGGVPQIVAPAGVPSAPAVAPASAAQSSLAAPRGLSYAVDIVFCIDVTGSMTPIIDAVKANALGFYDDVQANLTAKGKNVEQLRVRVIAFVTSSPTARPRWRSRRSSPCPRNGPVSLSS